MIEMIASVKTQPLSQKTHQSKLSANNTFQDQLDKSISNQKNLSEELRQQKITDQKKELESLKTRIKDLKEQQSEELEPKEMKKLAEKLAPLEELLGFLQNIIEDTNSMESPTIENSAGSVDLLTWVDTLKNFVETSVDEITTTGSLSDRNYFSAQKFSFLLENVGIQPNIPLQNNDLTTMNTMMNVFVESSSIVTDNTVTNTIKDESLVADTSNMMTAMLSEMEVVEATKLEGDLPEDAPKIKDAIKTDIAMKSSDFNMNKDTASDSDSNNNTEQKVTIKDLRTKNTESSTGTQEKSFSLENMDSATTATATDGDATNTESPSLKTSLKNENTTIAQRLYTSLSSSVSRVQVEALMQNMAGKMSMLLQDGKNELRMKLTPPELGQMKLTFITEDNVMRGKIVVETPEAKMFFEQNIDNLKETLAQAGVTLGNIDIDLGSQSDFSSKMQDEDDGFLQAIRPGSLENNIEQKVERKSMIQDLLVDFTA